MNFNGPQRAVSFAKDLLLTGVKHPGLLCRPSSLELPIFLDFTEGGGVGEAMASWHDVPLVLINVPPPLPPSGFKTLQSTQRPRRAVTLREL